MYIIYFLYYVSSVFWSQMKLNETGDKVFIRWFGFCVFKMFIRCQAGMRIRVWPKNPDPGLSTSNEGRFLKVHWMNILDNIKSLLFCFHTSGVRRTIYVLDSENQPGSGALGLTGDIRHQKYKNMQQWIHDYNNRSIFIYVDAYVEC